MSIDGLALQELREHCEEWLDDPSKDLAHLDETEVRLVLALMDEHDAALDAEGVGLKGEIRRFADEMYDCATVKSQAMHRVCQDLLTRWEERRWSIPLPGQSPEPSAGLREGVERVRDMLRVRQALEPELTAADLAGRAADRLDAALRADEEQSDGQ